MVQSQSGLVALCRDAGCLENICDELEDLRVQMDEDEMKLANLISDFDMLHAHSDAVARTRQVYVTP